MYNRCIENITPIKSIRLYCIEICMEGQMTEVRLCPSKKCDLWLYRMGRRPNLVELMEWFQHHQGETVIISEDEIRGLKNTPVKSIREKCLNCNGWQYSSVRECTELDCYLHPYRMGKKPKCKKEYESNDGFKEEKND